MTMRNFWNTELKKIFVEKLLLYLPGFFLFHLWLMCFLFHRKIISPFSKNKLNPKKTLFWFFQEKFLFPYHMFVDQTHCVSKWDKYIALRILNTRSVVYCTYTYLHIGSSSIHTYIYYLCKRVAKFKMPI